MPLTIYTGRSRALKAHLMREIELAMRRSESTIYVVVPAQFALQAEIDILSALSLTGSFRIQVIPPERLYARAFEKTGQLDAIRLNDEGRAMLLHMQAKRLKRELAYYASVAESPGFAKRATAQIKEFKQSGLTPADVSALAASSKSPALTKKLSDLSLLYAAYEQAAEGRLIDQEDEMREALKRIEKSPEFKDVTAMIYGFDLITVEIAEMLLALTQTESDVSLFLPLASARDRDGYLYEPVRSSLLRLTARLRDAGAAWRLEAAESSGEPDNTVRHFERELFCWPIKPYRKEQSSVKCFIAQNPRQEAEACAAKIRALVTRGGYRYREIAVACQDLERYHDALLDAFELYGVPIFLAESRPADRHALSRCLLSALKILSKGWQAEDVTLLLRSGYLPATSDESDRLVNYAHEKGLKGRRFRETLPMNEDDALFSLEAIRERAFAPILRLEGRLRASPKTGDRLEAVYQFLEEIGAREKIEAERATLVRDGFALWAAEGSQVFNRIVGALDQIYDLAPGKISLNDLSSLAQQALAATEIRALPQSRDAVSGGSADHMKSTQVRALFLLGMSEQSERVNEGLLSDAEGLEITAAGGALWRLGERERARMQKLSVKALLSLTSERLIISYAASDEKGEARREGSLITAARQVFKGMSIEKCGCGRGAEEAYMSRGAAVKHLPCALRENPDDECALRAVRALAGSEGGPAEIEKLRRAVAYRVYSGALPPKLANGLYGLESISISRLERFAQCPFRHFTDYALRPVPLKEFELTYADAGMFYHRAIELFTERGAASDEEAQRRMDDITGGILEKMLGGALSSSAVARAEGEALAAVARRAARALVSHQAGSRFETLGVELPFGKDGRLLRIGDSVLTGRIDRIDRFKDVSCDYLRVIDYKSGGKSLSLSEVYHGLAMQLTLYLAAALKSLGGKPAGAFYFAVKDPLVKTNSTDADEVEALRAKEMRMDGLVLRDERVVRAMATEPEKAVKVRFKMDDKLYSDAKVVSEDAFQKLIGRSAFMAETHLNGIRAGDTSVAPARLGERSGCDFCDYAAICQWDERVPGANARMHEKLTDAEVLTKLD